MCERGREKKEARKKRRTTTTSGFFFSCLSTPLGRSGVLAPLVFLCECVCAHAIPKGLVGARRLSLSLSRPLLTHPLARLVFIPAPPPPPSSFSFSFSFILIHPHPLLITTTRHPCSVLLGGMGFGGKLFFLCRCVKGRQKRSNFEQTAKMKKLSAWALVAFPFSFIHSFIHTDSNAATTTHSQS